MDTQTEFTCSLCGYKYGISQKKCVSCPMGRNCKVLCCPHCGYQTVDDSYIKDAMKMIRRLFEWIKQKLSMTKS